MGIMPRPFFGAGGRKLPSQAKPLDIDASVWYTCTSKSGLMTPHLPRGSRKVHACGGSVRPGMVRATRATSKETGKPTREGRKPLGVECRFIEHVHGEMSQVTLQQGDAVPLPEREMSSFHLHFFSCAAGGAKRVTLRLPLGPLAAFRSWWGGARSYQALH
jgi:hypothetical protein